VLEVLYMDVTGIAFLVFMLNGVVICPVFWLGNIS
jgi:hypothetical protein